MAVLLQERKLESLAATQPRWNNPLRQFRVKLSTPSKIKLDC
ncbi:MAG: hypothetical protein WC979_06670 [Candidatus Pacearchaeota archaeon]